MTENDRIFDMLLKEDEITWQSIIYDLVNTNEIDPWDVDIGALSSKYLEMLKKLKAMDFRVSGKVLLAAALLLKMKSNRLMSTDLFNFEQLFKPEEEETLEEAYEDGTLDQQLAALENQEKPSLIPRTPQPRERKVTIFDLVDALQGALDVKQRRFNREAVVDVKPPEKTRDITEVIKEVYDNIQKYFKDNSSLLFTDLVTSDAKEDKISTFVPLLHLTNEQKIDLLQQKPFGEISITLNGRT